MNMNAGSRFSVLCSQFVFTFGARFVVLDSLFGPPEGGHYVPSAGRCG
jgi:hypothetical protein